MEERLASLKKQRLTLQHPLLTVHEGYVVEETEDKTPSHFKNVLKESLIKSIRLTESTVAKEDPVWRGEVNHPLLSLDASNHSIYRRKDDLDEFTPHRKVCLELELVPRSHEEKFLHVNSILPDCSAGETCVGLSLPKYVFDWPKNQPG
jgi:hypothetical protein